MASNNVRDIIFNSILDNMELNNYFVLNADFTGRPFIEINKRFPERFAQIGIAEQNMIAVACGLALAGKTPVTYSPNPFVYLRAYDQIRNAIGCMNLKVIMVANGFGFVNPGLGVTHFPTESYNLISLCPNIEYCSVSDEAIANNLCGYIIKELKQAMFINIDFTCDDIIKSDENADIIKGWRYIKNLADKNTVILTQGFLTRIAIENDYKVNTSIIEIFKCPYNKSLLVDELKKYKKIIIAEEHQLHGGLGNEILALLYNNEIKTRIKCLGVDYGNKFPGTFGSREYFMNKFGVDKNKLLDAVNN